MTMKKNGTETKISVFLTVLFVAGLIPILFLAPYDYPCADDFGFSAYSHIAWQETHSVLAVAKGAWDTVVERWYGWQGTFSSIFVMALQPAIWGESAYCLVPWIMIGAMSASSLFLFHTILIKVIRVRRTVFLSISMIYLFFALECMIDKTQGFFWFNGAAHYMIPHSVALVLIGVLIRLLMERQRRLFRLILTCFLALFVGGSNYITALITAVLFCSALIVLLFLKKKKEGRLLLPSFSLFLIAFALNALAPGNSVRQEAMEYRPGVFKSILLSFYYCVEYVTDTWFDWTYLLFLLALLPFLWEAVKAVGTRFSYPCPLLLPLYSYCLLSAMFTPSLYATGMAGGGRIFNIIFLDLLLLLIAVLFYSMGWLYRRMALSSVPSGSCLERSDIKLYLSGILLFMLFIGILYTAVDPDHFTSASACRSLLTGEAAAYGEEADRRTQALRETGKEDVTLECFTVRPYLLFFSDIEEDPEDWKNRSMARYYQREHISGTHPDPFLNIP